MPTASDALSPDPSSDAMPSDIEPAHEPHDRSGSTDIVVIGLMGSGKTTVGFAVAQRLGRPFVDSDSLLCLHQHRTAREIADAAGIDVLHAAEHDAARLAMSATTKIVFAAAASVMDLDRSDAERLLADAWVVWLDAPAEVLERRIDADETDSHRPRFDRDTLHERCELDERRRRTAEGIAHLHVDVSSTAIEDIVEHVVSAWDNYRRNAA